MPLEQAIEQYVKTGSHISIGGFTINRNPMAAVYEIIRQKIKDLHLYAHSNGTGLDELIENILDEDRLDDVVTEYSNDLGDRLTAEVLPRFRAGMRDINAVVSSAFVLGQAIIEAANHKFRPVLLTTLTTSLGMLPLWFGGGLLWEPLAIAIIFGLFFATVIILLFVPMLYRILYKVSFKDYSLSK